MGISQSLEASTRAHGTGAGDEARSPAAVAAAGRSVLAGLIGSGIQASRCPSLHEREGAEQGLRYIYKIIDIAALDLAPDVLPELLTAARRFGFAGLNITHPCKQTVIPLLDALSPDARALGAVNTVVFENGQAIGHNTDWSGFAESFRRELADVARGRVVQFGAGGAGAAVAHALLTLGVDRLTIIDTDAARAEELAAALGDRFGAGRAVAGADVADAVGGGRRDRQHDAARDGEISRHAARREPPAAAAVGRRHRLLPARDRAPARRAGLRLPHHVGRRHGGLPGGRRLPAVCRRRAGRRAHAPSLRGDVTAQRHDASGNRKPVRTAIATVCLSGTLPEKLEAIAAAKFKGVEIFENDLLSFNGTPAEVRRMAADLGLEIITFQPFRDFEGMPEPHRGKALSRAERKFDVMAELGCDLLLVCSNVSPDALGGVDRAAADFRELGERAASAACASATRRWPGAATSATTATPGRSCAAPTTRRSGSSSTRFHILARKTDLTPMRAIPRDRIFLVQLADAPLLEMDYLSWSRHYRSFPGQGELPVDAFMDALQATGYDGLLSHEIFSDRFRAGSARSVAIDGQRSLIFMLDELRRRTGTAVPGLPALPPRAACAGVEFVEFAMDQTAAADFETLLAGLGFAKAGEHKSKDVARWRQGDINIIVNREKEGFAHSFNITHGSAVCAIALRVADASATIERAVKLLDQPFRQGVGPGELEIPAVRGLGGSLVYFVDRTSAPSGIWDVDFDPVAAAPAPGRRASSASTTSRSRCTTRRC